MKKKCGNEKPNIIYIFFVLLSISSPKCISAPMKTTNQTREEENK